MLNSTEFSTPSSASPTSASRRDELLRKAWSLGKLRWLLNSDQKTVYDQYREWEQRDSTKEGGNFPRVFVFDMGRRVGKTTIRFLVRCEDCIRHPKRIYRYASAYQKNIDEIVNDVSRYVLATCPDDLRPQYIASKQRFVFPNGSEIRLVGLDMHPDGLRGQACDGDDLSEAAFIKGLQYAIKNVLYPQYQGRPWARICLESSAPVESDSDYDEVFVEDAKTRNAWVYRTIDDNPRLTHDEREEFIRAAGGREHVDCKREYFNLRVRDPVGSVVPEFVAEKHVRLCELPRYAHCYVGADPGTRDLFGLVFFFVDFKRAKIVVTKSWAARNAGLTDVAAVIDETEQDWANVVYWDGKELQPNPYRRVSDTDARTILELKREHSIAFNGADKKTAKSEKDSGSASKLPEAKLYGLRNAFQNDRIEIWPNSGPLERQLNKGRWNEQRTDFERTDELGHLDCVMALVYGLRAVQWHLNPEKPLHVPGEDPNVFFYPDAAKQFGQTKTTRVLNSAFGAGSRFREKKRRFRA